MKRLLSLTFTVLSMITLVGCSGTKEVTNVSEEKVSSNKPNLMKNCLKKLVYYHLKMKNN